MNLLSKKNIRPSGKDDTVFSRSLWGPLFTFLIFLVGLLAGLALFIYCYQFSIIWGMLLASLYSLIMWGISQILFRALMATRSPANWLARIGPDGMLLKYRSYLHDDSPEEDPIALYLAWREIDAVQMQQEEYTTTDLDGKRQTRRWFLSIILKLRNSDIQRVKSALEFENQRKPAHFKIDELKHELFIARKKRASDSEIAFIKNEIAHEKRRHPGRHKKTRFRDRPVVFIDPDRLRMELSHITPGKSKLRQLLALRTRVTGDQQQQFAIEKPMSQAEFDSLLASLLGRGETIEAVKLVQLQMGLTTTEARSFIEKRRQ